MSSGTDDRPGSGAPPPGADDPVTPQPPSTPSGAQYDGGLPAVPTSPGDPLIPSAAHSNLHEHERASTSPAGSAGARERGGRASRGGRGGGSGPTFLSWMRRTARLWGFLGFVAVILFVFRSVVLPFLLGALVAYVLAPVLNFTCRLRVGGFRVPRWIWLVQLYVVLFGLCALFFTSFVPRVSADLKRIVGEAPEFWQQARQRWVPRVAGWVRTNFGGEPEVEKNAIVAEPPAPRLRLRRLPDGSLELDTAQLNVELVRKAEGHWILRSADHAPEPASERIETQIDRYVQEIVASSEKGLNQVVKLAQRALLGLLSAITMFILTLMISAFLLVDTGRILAMLRGLVDRKFHQDFDNVIVLIDRGLSGAIRGQLLICLVNGVLTWVGLTLFGVKYPFLLGLLAAVMSLIPIFGSILSSIPIVLVALVSGEHGIELLRALLILAWIIGIHLVEANLLNPKIIGSAARIHPLIVIFSVVAGERTYGPVGALLAVPLVSAVQAVFLYILRKVRGPDDTGSKAVAADR